MVNKNILIKIKDKIKTTIDLSVFPFEFSVLVPSGFRIVSLRRQREIAYDSDQELKKYTLYEGRYLLVATLKGGTFVAKIRFNPAYVVGFFLQGWGGSPPHNLVRAREYYLLRPDGRWELVSNPIYSKQRSPILVSSSH